MTPHVAFASTAALIELRRRACEEVVRALRGEPLHHQCNDTGPAVPLDGGVASDLRFVAGPDGPAIVKRALPRLRVAAEWTSDPARSATEVAAIAAAARLLGPEAVPEILWTRPEEHLFAMRVVDPRLRNWKKDLLAGRIDPRTGRRAGELLGRLHARAMKERDLALKVRFADRTYFRELRIDPFFGPLADRDPVLRARLAAVVEGMEARACTFVHGDFSPKNILANGGELVILDFEVAHWGDPRFDVAFCLSHLLLKSWRGGAPEAAFAELIGAFVDAYRAAGPDILDASLWPILGCLLLARLDGKSPVDYAADLDQPAVRAAARAMIDGRPPAIEALGAVGQPA